MINLEQCQLFIHNKEIMKQHFMWQGSNVHLLSSLLYTTQGREVDGEHIKVCKEIIKNETGVFSNIRGMGFLILATKLSLEEKPEQKIKEVLAAYGILKQAFWGSEYLPLVAYGLTEQVTKDKYEAITLEAKAIYERMKGEHPFLTSKEDVGIATLLAVSERPIGEAIGEMEACYSLLKDYFFSGNAVQSLSHVLTFSTESSKAKCERVMGLYHGLKEKGLKYSGGLELSLLGLLALMTTDVETAVEEILEVNDYLLTAKGFGAMGTGKKMRVMYATLLVIEHYKGMVLEETTQMLISQDVLGRMMAEQVVVAALIASTVAASSASC